MGPPVNQQIACPHRPALRDPDFLTQHPTPESFVVQALVSKINLNAFPTGNRNRLTLLDAEFSSSGLALRLVNATCLLGCYTQGI